MIELLPFSDQSEHIEFCCAADVPFEPSAVGFKIIQGNEKLGMCQLRFVGDAAYVLNHCAIDDKISVSMLANLFTSVVEFLRRAKAAAVIYPIANENDRVICESVGFDRVSDTMFVFDFLEEDAEKNK